MVLRVVVHVRGEGVVAMSWRADCLSIDEGLKGLGTVMLNFIRNLFASKKRNLAPPVSRIVLERLLGDESLPQSTRDFYRVTSNLAGPITRSELYELFSIPPESMSDEAIELRGAVLARLAGSGKAFSKQLADGLGSDYLFALADGSIAAWSNKRNVCHHVIRDVVIFTDADGGEWRGMLESYRKDVADSSLLALDGRNVSTLSVSERELLDSYLASDAKQQSIPFLMVASLAPKIVLAKAETAKDWDNVVAQHPRVVFTNREQATASNAVFAASNAQYSADYANSVVAAINANLQSTAVVIGANAVQVQGAVSFGDGTAANNLKLTNVADGTIAAGSSDVVTGGQLYTTNKAVAGAQSTADTALASATAANTRLDVVDTTLVSHDTRITTAQTTANAALTLAQLDAQAIKSLSKRVDGIDGRVAALEASSRHVQQRIDGSSAMSSAMNNAVMPPLAPGERAIVGGIGYAGTQAAASFGVVSALQSGNSLSAKIAVSNGFRATLGLGGGFKF
jgi:hypothetical protein